MQELVIASNNKGKIKEIKELVTHINLLSLRDIGFADEIPEPYHTFHENAHTKADTIHRFSGKNVFADDSGICVAALDGAPGVFSARYAGEGATDEANLNKLIDNMTGQADRRAWYQAVICLIWNSEAHYFEGTCQGTLLEQPIGDGGFGYDPIFVPDGHTQTFAQLAPEVKNAISHRGKAVRAMVEFINKQIR
jgi:XTP/dITP diphosphohydrolase